MKKLLAITLSLCMILSLCTVFASAEEKVEVNIIHYFIEDSGETMNDVYLELEAKFLEEYAVSHPNVKFNISRIQQAQAEEKLQTVYSL